MAHDKTQTQSYFDGTEEDSVTGSPVTENNVTDNSPGWSKWFFSQNNQHYNWQAQNYGSGNSNTSHNGGGNMGQPQQLTSDYVRSRNASLLERQKAGKGGSNGSGNGNGNGGGGNCPCAKEKKKQTQTGADIKVKAQQAVTTGATRGGTSSTGGGSSSAGSGGGGSATTSGSGECECEHEDSVISPNNEVVEKSSNNKRINFVREVFNGSQAEDECISIDKIIRGLNNVIKAVKIITNRAVMASGKTGSLRTVETSFIIVTRQNRLDVSEKENVKYIYGKNLVISKRSSSVHFDLKNLAINEQFIAQLHTHFYSKKQGSYTGIPHSTTDISNLRTREEGFMDFVHSDTKIFAIVITDIKKATKNIFEKFTEDDLLDQFRKLNSEADSPTTIEEVERLYTEIIIKILGKEEENGLGFYVTINDGKDCFKKLN